MRDDHPRVSDEHAGVGVNLQRTTLIILCEPVTDSKTSKHIPKRVHCLENTQEVWYYAMSSHTIIEDAVNAKRQA